MSSRQPLQDGLFRYRKHRVRSLDGSVPGLPYTHYRRPTTPPLGSIRSHGTGGYQHDLYNRPRPTEYNPAWSAPAVQEDEYVADTDAEPHRLGLSQQERPFRAVPGRMPAEPRFDYEESKAVNNFLLAAMEVQYRQFAEGEEVPTLADLWCEHSVKAAAQNMGPAVGDNQSRGSNPPHENGSKEFPDFTDLVDALGHLRTVLPEDHPDIVRLRAAAHEMLQHPELLPQLEDFGVTHMESKLGRGNPYEIEPTGRQEEGIAASAQGGFYEQLDVPSTLDDLLASPEFNVDALPGNRTAIERMPGLDAILGIVNEQPQPDVLGHLIEQDLFDGMPMEALEEQMPPEAIASEMAAYDPLSQGMYGMTAEQEIEQAIDQVTGRMAPEFDPYMAAQQIFDQQMQYMDNPFLMPGMMPMGPMYGPAPGM